MPGLEAEPNILVRVPFEVTRDLNMVLKPMPFEKARELVMSKKLSLVVTVKPDTKPKNSQGHTMRGKSFVLQGCEEMATKF